jgi:hypothetical protein
MNNNPPAYRFRKNLAPATVGERKMHHNATLCCTWLSPEEQRRLCQERIVRLRELKAFLVDEDEFRAELQRIEEAIANEQAWESQLLNAPPVKKKPHKVAASYPGLLPCELQRISKIATTSRGVIYAKYSTSRVRSCSFVSRGKLTTAIAQIKKLKVNQIWATQFGGLGIKDEGGACFEFDIEEIAPLLVRWNNGSPIDDIQPMTAAQPSSFVQYKLKKDAIECLLQHQFTYVSVEDEAEAEGEVFLRIKRDQDFYGVIVINEAGEIYVQPGAPGAQLTRVADVAAAVAGLIAAFVPPAALPGTQETITKTEWDNLKAIAKVGSLTPQETLAIVLDSKYLRPLELGEVATPRMVLSQYFPEIKRRLSMAVAERKALALKSVVFPQESDREEYSRIENLYPRLFARLRGLVDAALVYGLTLRDVEVQPFSISIVSSNHEVLGKVSVTVEGFLFQAGGQYKTYATATEMLAELKGAIAAQHQSR